MAASGTLRPCIGRIVDRRNSPGLLEKRRRAFVSSLSSPVQRMGQQILRDLHSVSARANASRNSLRSASPLPMPIFRVFRYSRIFLYHAASARGLKPSTQLLSLFDRVERANLSAIEDTLLA
jgi:hypothetical protein